ncbi:MAG: hypothetical protein N3F09_08855 [Bacteroidia bacterium]|nr:hypothetical protein [Bacteroidia bacterium]
MEIGEEDVKYKKSIDGPNYSIRKSNLLSIKLKNGETENYSENSNTSKTREESENNTREESENKNESTQWWEDENVKRYLEGVAKDVGEQIIRNCAIGKIDNHTTEIYWDGVIKDPITSEISLPIIAKWKPKFTDGSGKWIKGKILISKEGTKRWVYQNNSGVNFPDCAKNFKIK